MEMSRSIFVASDSSCHQSRPTKKMKQRICPIRPMGSGDRLQNAIKDKTQTLKLLVSTLALLHVQLRPANPAKRAPERPNSRWKTLDLLFLR
jgi:hypothetical protein